MMRIDGNIRLFKGIPDVEYGTPVDYAPIEGSLVRNGDNVYLELPTPREGYEFSYIIMRTEEYETQLRPSQDEYGRYPIYGVNCSAEYIIVYERIPSYTLTVITNSESAYAAQFQYNGN